MSIKSGLQRMGLMAAMPVIHKRIGDTLTAALIAESAQGWHTVGFRVNFTSLLAYMDITPRMPFVTPNLSFNTVYIAGELPTGADPVSGVVPIADLHFNCLAAGTATITLTEVKPILRTAGDPVLLPEAHEDAAFAVDADAPPVEYGVVTVRVVIE